MTVKNMSQIQTKFGNATLNNSGYYRITSSKEGNKGKLLHRVIFEDFYNIKLDEEFPEGIHIHHIDGNPLNNAIWNLMPMAKGDHSSMHNKGSKLSEEHRRQISERMKGEKNPMYGKHLSKKTKEKLRHSHLGFTHSEETKRKLSELHKGKIHSLDSKLKMSKNKNTTGFFRVHKMPHKECRQGFTWRYEYYNDTGKRRKTDSVDLKKLKKKVLAIGEIWKVINLSNANLTCEDYGYCLEELM